MSDIAAHPLDHARTGGTAPEPIDGMLAPRVAADEARGNVRRWVRRSWLAPSGFRHAKVGDAQSVQVPCYAFNTNTVTEYKANTTKSRSSGSGDNKRSESYTEHKAGNLSVDFRDLTVCSVPTLDVPNLSRLEPWPTDALIAVDPAASAASLPASVVLPEASTRARQRVDQEIRRRIEKKMGGKNPRVQNLTTATTGESYRHLLLPVLVVPVITGFATQYVLVNGVTGKVGGRRPTSAVKRWLAAFGAIWLLFVLAGALLWPTDCNPVCDEGDDGYVGAPTAAAVVVSEWRA
jgi:hypothetical protein